MRLTEVPVASTAVLDAPETPPTRLAASPKTASARLVSLDAYRGLIMLAMVSAGFGFAQVARSLPGNDSWQFLAFHFDHVTWEGGGFWDMIQPAFMFMVGVALPYSLASRRARGESAGQIALHTVFRALVLIFLGIFLSSNFAAQTDWVFTNVLTQIGLGYCFLALLAGRGRVVQLAAVLVILVGYWLAFLAYEAPPTGFDYGTVGFGAKDFTPYTGLFAHWNPNTNLGAAFDVWWMNLFPRAQPFLFNRGGYLTLNFIPSLATMILGLMTGEMLRRTDQTRWQKLGHLLIAAVVCGGLGWLAGETVCPIVKRIWTPSWALYSAGWVFLMLAVLYLLIDVAGWKCWSLPLVVVGMNSIAIYCVAQMLRPWVRDTFRRHLGSRVFDGTYFGVTVFDPLFAPVAQTVVFLIVAWFIAWWMYRRGIFVKI
jgi:predicted acyltransferase